MEVSTCVKMWYVYNELMLRGTKHGTLSMVKSNNTATPKSVKTSGTTVKIANLNPGAVYTLPKSGWATGSSVLDFATNNAAGSLANITVRPTEFFNSLGINPSNWVKHESGMFCTNTGTRGHQLQCPVFGVQKSTIATNKSKAYKKMDLATVGGKDASFNLGVIATAIKASGGKITTGNVKTGNTLCMLLSGSNTIHKKHAFFGKPLVELVVTPVVKIK